MKEFRTSSSILAIACLLNCMFFVSVAKAQAPCKTPDNRNGSCLPHQQCGNYLQGLQATLSPTQFDSFIRESRCNDDQNIHLCCVMEASTLDEGLLSLIESCRESAEQRVAYGEIARLAAYPWMALLEYDDPPPNNYECGGSLITNRYVLTAAHCMKGLSKIVAVVLGEHNLDTDPDCQRLGRKKVCSPPRERYLVDRLIPHPEYRKHHFDFDIALIKLNSTVEFKKHIKPICLPITPSSLNVQSHFIVAGWGTMETNQASRVLRKAVVQYQERSVCENTYRQENITSHHLCIGGNGPMDTCKGDSGGPLFIPALYQPSKVRTIQYGIVSFGPRSCSALEKFPSIYTNVTEFIPWITSNIVV